MAGGFDAIDPERCAHYAGFAAKLDRRSFDFIYWFLFVLVMIMLFVSSWKYSGDLESIRVQGLEPGSRRYKHKMKKCMAICSVYAVVSIVSAVMEVYALMALQFCDGEDLMPLYWSTWTMMQVGSVIAIIGIVLSSFNSLRGRKNPPWALALGTPILVVAGIGHAVRGAVHKRVRRVRSMSRGRRRAVSWSGSVSSSDGRLETSGGVPMSRAQTLRADDSDREEDSEISAKFLGFTPDGAPIMKFVDDPGKMEPEQGVVIGRGDGHVIIAFKKAMTVIGHGGNSSNNSNNNNNNSGNSNSGPSTVAAVTEPPRSLTFDPSTRPPVVRISSPPRWNPKDVEDSPV
ncbi:hypothetical protein C8A00DRAFT_31638 [Chaetomidium leptoderma]|uniref:Uncharacterized protein n=1 Tax=Chaetomidium leptoderma TaxID=669021 RepID=A0AAN6VPP1_9PEZI|nr:hypothetical protein C8A00DRAFT_31638 [Chaetomidium leptoderma]